jgi:hypothetical protein
MHIADWSAWSDEGIVSDEIKKITGDYGKFMQVKTIFNTNETDRSSYLLEYDISAIAETYKPNWITIPNNVTLEYGIEGISVTFLAEDVSGISSYFTNWSSNLTMSSGLLTNSTNIQIGTYYVNVSVNDTLNNIASTIFKIIVQDTTKPTLSITSPENTTYYSTNIPLNVVCTDTNPISSYLYSLDGAINVSFTPNIVLAVTGYEVYHTTGIFCNDSVNNWAWEYRKFYVGNYPATNGSASGYAYADASRKAGYCNSKLPGGHNC